jgi:hypothetical protein
MSPATLRKLHALAEQRCAYFIELHQSGRWRHYYTAEQLTAEMRDAVQIAERLHHMAGELGGDQATTSANVVPLFARAS